MRGCNEDEYWFYVQARAEGWNQEEDYDDGSIDMKVDEMILERKRKEKNDGKTECRARGSYGQPIRAYWALSPEALARQAKKGGETG